VESTTTVTPAPITIVATETTVTKTAGTYTRTITKRTTTTSKITKTVTATYALLSRLSCLYGLLTFSPVSELLPMFLARAALLECSEACRCDIVSFSSRKGQICKAVMFEVCMMCRLLPA
jgi:hypothetical protein